MSESNKSEKKGKTIIKRMKIAKKPFMIAVTGGIGSGKSTVMSAIKEKGYFTLSCDLVASELYGKISVRRKLKKLFPSAVSGRIFLKADKKKISDIVFNDKSALKRLNALMHPLIMKEIFARAKKSGERFVYVEVPLLFESSWQDYFDKVLIVMRDDEERIKSVMSRSTLTREEVLVRISNQTDYLKLDKSSYEVILNDGTESVLKKKAEEFCLKTEAELSDAR